LSQSSNLGLKLANASGVLQLANAFGVLHKTAPGAELELISQTEPVLANVTFTRKCHVLWFFAACVTLRLLFKFSGCRVLRGSTAIEEGHSSKWR
jgi:hypothetical protein